MAAPDGFVDLGETRHQIAQFFLQPGEITVHWMDLLPQLRFEPENMILPRRLALEKSPTIVASAAAMEIWPAGALACGFVEDLEQKQASQSVWSILQWRS